MIIGGTNFNVMPWPVPQTVWSIKYGKNSNNYFDGRDRGPSSDQYFGRIRFVDTAANITSLQTTLASKRSGIILSGFNSETMLFGANLDYSTYINCAITKIGPRKHISVNKLFEIEATFRAIQPTFVSVVPSLSGLNLQKGYNADRSFEVNTKFSFNQIATYLDHGDDTLTFTGEFLQSTDEMKAIRSALLSTVRANAITFPVPYLNISPGFQPFGPMCGPFKVKVIDWSDEMVSRDKWILKIVFTRDVPAFSAGNGPRNINTITYLQAGNGARNLSNMRLGRRQL
jgi:hypothetical protein